MTQREMDGPTQPLCDALRQSLITRIVILEKKCEDLEQRVRDNEKFKWRLYGAAAVIGAASGIGVNFLV